MHMLPSCLGAGRPARGPLSSPLCPRSARCHRQLPSPVPPALHHDSIAGASSHREVCAIPHSCISRKRTLLLIFPPCCFWVIPGKTRGACWLSQPRGIWGSGSGLWTSSWPWPVGTGPVLPSSSPSRAAALLLRSRQCPGASHLCFVRQVLELSAASALC